MIPGIRLATQEEVDKIKDRADLTPASAVWTWPKDNGEPDMAVIRACTEIDPMFFSPTSNNQRKVMFAWGIFNVLRAMNTREVYFDVDAEGMEDYISLLEKMGAEKTTTKPQFRFKLVI